MGTRADFYVGKGKSAEWIGSVAYDGHRDGIPEEIRLAINEVFYRNAVGALIESCGHGTKPEQGWPWPWDNSETTDRAYCFHDGKVYDSRWGKDLVPCNVDEPHNDTEDRDQQEKDFAAASIDFDGWPDMADKKAVTYGKRSGAIFISLGRRMTNQFNEPSSEHCSGA
ncbi:MAG: hypothetical protein ACRCWJ_14920 [Casimicrobium sp.]